MSKTIDNILDEYAVKHGYYDWTKMFYDEGIEIGTKGIEEIAERYAKSQTQELQEQNAELVEMLKQTVRALDGNGFPRLRSQIEELLTKYNHLNKKP